MAKFKGLIRDCVVCGNEYRSPQSHAHVLTCSRECGYARRVVANKVEHTELQCKHCDKAFTSVPCHAERRVYCSSACMNACPETLKRRQLSIAGARNPAWKGGLVVWATSSTGKLYARQQPHLENEKSARRKRAKGLATPAWFDARAVRRIYQGCRAVSELTGLQHHVDHVVPLKSDLVCGLHTACNLQVMPGPDNLKKSNRTWPDMW